MSLAAGTELLYREAALLDRQQWDDWLALYLQDCVFWVPSWTSETTVTRDPETEVSPVQLGTQNTQSGR